MGMRRGKEVAECEDDDDDNHDDTYRTCFCP